MDMSGPMPRRAWIEVRDVDGKLLASVPSRIQGGTILTDLPAFEPETLGRMIHCRADQVSGEVWRYQDELELLPTEPTQTLLEIG